MNLVLSSFGTSLLKEDNMFVIHSHDGSQVLDPQKVRTISISKGAKISSDAVILAISHEIDVQFIDKVGTPLGRVWSVKYGSISTIRRKQLDFIFKSESVAWIKDITIRKIDNQAALLWSLSGYHFDLQPLIETAVGKLSDYKQKIMSAKYEVISEFAPTLRGWEGQAAKIYFEIIAQVVPPVYCFNGRSQHPATDVFNCLLNYGYGMLYGKVESALIKAGIDPYIGVFHREDYNRPVLAFDVIEIFRVWIDYVVVSLCMQKAIDEDCYSIKDGAYWLENLGRRILIQSVNDYMDQVVMLNALERSRASHIDLYAQQLAQMFLNTYE